MRSRSVGGAPGAAARSGDPAAPPGPAPTVTDSTALHLPIERYLPTADDRARISKASGVLLQECMRRHGHSWSPQAAGARSGPVTMTEMRYGVNNPRQAQLTGYHFGPANPGYHAPSPAPSAPPSPEAEPDRGCSDEVRQKLSAGAPFLGAAPLAQRINTDGFAASLRDPSVQAVFRQWAGCMRGQGFRYTTPMDAVNDPSFTGPSPAAEETRTATADLRCKERYNVVGTWFAAESGNERSAIRAHASELANVQRQMRAQRSTADSVVSH
ncbi:hypothetical protein ACIHFE_14350 [Streptomyces sp. NPDC052396]|uniref:hypothetical protein n=1 Tax=Streptomyces sp. NPDC052396 TaxID=3365689 RepID=UPI0037D5313F